MKLGGIEIKLGSFKGGLWYDSNDQFYTKLGWGVKLAVRWGPWVCPIPKLWSWDKSHRWGDNTWFTLKGKFGIWPFMSVTINKYGFYLGAKDNGWGQNNILILSATIRRDRRK